MSITVTTQTQLDAAIAAKEEVIYIESPAGVWLTIREEAPDSRIVLWGSSSAVLRGSSSAVLWGSSSAVLRGSSSAVLRESSSAVLRESSSAELWGSSRAVLWGSSRAVLWESSSAVLWGSSSAVLRGSSSAELWGSSSAVLWESSSAVLRESSSAVLRESSSADAKGSSNLHLRDNAAATAGKLVSVHLYSQRATFEGGVLIDLTSIDFSNAEQWADYHGVIVEDGKLHVYKAVGGDFKSDRGMAYPISETVIAPDWDGQDRCGGGLHFGPTPRHALAYHDDKDDVRFLLCAVPVDATVGINNGDIPKCKARECVVLYEVDEDGERLEVEVEA